MSLRDILLKLEKKSGLESLQFSKDGAISFVFNDRYTTTLEKSADEHELTLYGVIGQLPFEDKERYLLALLQANLFGRATGGASIGLDPDTQEIILFRTFIIAHLPFDSFFEELTHFLHMQQEWTEKLKDKVLLYDRGSLT